MLRQLLLDFFGQANAGTLVVGLQVAVIALLAGIFWLLARRGGGEESNFSVREADRLKERGKRLPNDPLAEARMRRKAEPLRLEGLSLDGPAHRILGIQANADAAEIQRAYRELMKRYHPDRVGRPGSREWKDAQQIAETLNRARDEMLRKR